MTTSDVCNKESTSVSYETLVVGTTTHGTAKKQNWSALKSTATQQNQRLNIAGAETPLTAMGTLTSLLRNSTKVMDYLSQKVRNLKEKYRFKVLEKSFLSSQKPVKNYEYLHFVSTSDVCNKESKSVSYETLVVGTTTHGTAEKFIGTANVTMNIRSQRSATHLPKPPNGSKMTATL